MKSVDPVAYFTLGMAVGRSQEATLTQGQHTFAGLSLYKLPGANVIINLLKTHAAQNAVVCIL